MRSRRLWAPEVKSFFSSRRRHTESIGDWSSDVCSSDLPDATAAASGVKRCGCCCVWRNSAVWQIGRAACRERGEISVGAGSLKKKKRTGMTLLTTFWQHTLARKGHSAKHATH